MRSIAVKWYALVAVFAIVPLVWTFGALRWWRRMRNVRQLAGKICKVCGYDMRETPRRCSECGSVAEV
jgi:predicted amidophosphoribosyltransferase